MELTIINPPLDFWSLKSDIAYPALLQYGYDVYALTGDLTNQSKWIYVILSNGQSQTVDPIPAGYTFSHTIKANAGFPNTGNTLNPNPNNDAGLIALWGAYPELNVLNNSDVTFDDFKGIDLTGIPKEDFTINNEGDVIKDMASEPYTKLLDVNGVVIKTVEGNPIYAIKDF